MCVCVWIERTNERACVRANMCVYLRVVLWCQRFSFAQWRLYCQNLWLQLFEFELGDAQFMHIDFQGAYLSFIANISNVLLSMRFMLSVLFIRHSSSYLSLVLFVYTLFHSLCPCPFHNLSTFHIVLLVYYYHSTLKLWLRAEIQHASFIRFYTLLL